MKEGALLGVVETLSRCYPSSLSFFPFLFLTSFALLASLAQGFLCLPFPWEGATRGKAKAQRDGGKTGRAGTAAHDDPEGEK